MNANRIVALLRAPSGNEDADREARLDAADLIVDLTRKLHSQFDVYNDFPLDAYKDFHG